MAGKTEADERAKALIERARADYPKAWVPSEAETPEFVGTFIRLDKGTTSFGPCHIAIFADAKTGEETAVWLLHSVLRNAMARERPQAGELVCIRWLGKRNPVGGGSAYQDYRVVVDRPIVEPAWSELGGDFDVNDPGPAEPFLDDEVPF